MSARVLRFVLVATGVAASLHAQITPAHPRLLVTAAERTRLLAKVNANDPSWQALKARADVLATYPVQPYKFADSAAAPPGTIYYTYQGEGWYEAALPLAFAYEMTGDTAYSRKLIELAQEMIRAQSDPESSAPKRGGSGTSRRSKQVGRAGERSLRRTAGGHEPSRSCHFIGDAEAGVHRAKRQRHNTAGQ